jgi:hypothetical protein
MRGGGLSQFLGGIEGAIIASKKVNDYWCYLEYKDPEGNTQHHMLEIDKESSSEVIEKMKSIFSDRVMVVNFSEKGEEINKNTLKDLQSKHNQEVDKNNHPLPEIKPEKALLVVVCPALAARHSGEGNQFKLHANDSVVVVNKQGCYSFCYLDPGEYLLVSQSENANGFKMNLEAGKDYYFLQNIFMGAWKAQTSLSRNTKELVMHELSGAYWSDWNRKK